MNTPESGSGGREKSGIYRGSKDASVEGKPANYVPPKPTILDEMRAGKKNAHEVAQAIVDEAYGPLKQYCALPEGFSDRQLGYEIRGIDEMDADALDELSATPQPLIIDPRRPQVEAVELLEAFLAGDPKFCQNGDPYQPLFGANFVGLPGCGKTHIMSAFARRMKDFHDAKLVGYRRMVAEFVNKEYVAYQKAILGRADPDDTTTVWKIDVDPQAEEGLDALKRDAEGDIESKRRSLRAAAAKLTGKTVEQKAPSIVFEEKLAHFQAALARMQYQPPDLLYLDFESLWELCSKDKTTREQALEAIIRAKVLFLDDVHPKGDIERVQIVLHVIEGRYAAGRMGTFMTTNLTTQELAGGDEGHIARRLESRCNEMFYTVDFEGCVDWRTQVKQRRITLARTWINDKIAPMFPDDEQTEEASPEASIDEQPPEDSPPAEH